MTLISSYSAIEAALAQDWKLAVKINEELIKDNSKDTETLLRLSFAYIKLGKLTKAKQNLLKVIKYDPYNKIAEKNLQKIRNVTKKDLLSDCEKIASPLLFLEDPGKTKIVNCVNVAPQKTLITINCGQLVKLIAKSKSIEVRDSNNHYLGALPDDLTFRLLKLIFANNTYSVHIKKIGKNSLSVFIREITRGKKFLNQPSFLASSIKPLTKRVRKRK